MQLKIIKDFAFAHRGVEVRSYAAGETIETDDAELITVATAEGWIEDPKADKPPSNKARKAAPENK
jgi:hypothetical protein